MCTRVINRSNQCSIHFISLRLRFRMVALGAPSRSSTIQKNISERGGKFNKTLN